MICQSTSGAERQYWAGSAEETRRCKDLSLVVNDCMTIREADFLLACAEQGVEDWPYLVETIFDRCGWPDDDLSEIWLDRIGQRVWQVYQMYRGF